MKKHKKWLLLLLLFVGTTVAGFFVGKGRKPEPLPPLPPEVIEVEVVKEIEVPGPERVVEVLKWRTREVPVEVPVVEEVVKLFCPDEDEEDGEEGTEEGEAGRPTPLPRFVARVAMEAEKYEGTATDGRVKFGWKGRARCDVKGEKEGRWLTLADEPFDLESSYAVTTIAPDVERPFKWRLEVRGGLWKGLDSDLGNSGWEVGASYYPWRRVGVWGGYQRAQSVFIPSIESSFKDSRVSGGVALTLGNVR